MGSYKLTEVDVNALISSSKEISSTKFNWNSKIGNIDNVTKKLSRVSAEHDGCLDSGIKSLSRLSNRLGEMKREGSIINSGVATAIASFTAAEHGYSTHTDYDYKDYNLEKVETLIPDEDAAYKGKGNKGVVKLAKKQLSSSNKSKIGGEKYWRSQGYDKSVEWCACFVSWCMKKNGVSNKVVKRSAAVKDIYNQSLNQKTFHSASSNYKPKAGDLIVWQNNQSHIGIVEKYENGVVTTIEGNTDNKNRYYSKVARHTFTKSGGYGGCSGFISPKYKKSK